MRARQASLFSSTVLVTRGTAAGPFDPTTASYATGTASTIYTGAALVRPNADHVGLAGDTSIDLSAFTVKFPANTAVEVGDVISVTASAHDAGLVGMVFRITEIANDEWQICRKVQAVAETTRPAA